MDQVHQQLDMAVVAILSHGENGSIICTNGEKVNIQLYIYTNHNWSARCPLKTYSASSTIGRRPRWRGNPSSSSSNPAAGWRLTPGWTRTDWTTTGWSGWTGWSTIIQTSSKGFLTESLRSWLEIQAMRTFLSPMPPSQLMWRTETTWKAPGKMIRRQFGNQVNSNLCHHKVCAMPLQSVHEAQLRGGPCQPAGQGDTAAEDLLHQQGGETGGVWK